MDPVASMEPGMDSDQYGARYGDSDQYGARYGDSDQYGYNTRIVKQPESICCSGRKGTASMATT